MMYPQEYIAWIDLETTGVDPDVDDLLEVAMVVTTMSGESLTDMYHALAPISNLGAVMERTEQVVYDMHEESGLWSDVWHKNVQGSRGTLTGIAQDMCTILDTVDPCGHGVFYFGGNSIHLDRMFVHRFLPEAYRKLSHRSVDMTSVSLVVNRNSPIDVFMHSNPHRAYDDVQESVLEYRYFTAKLQEYEKEITP